MQDGHNLDSILLGDQLVAGNDTEESSSSRLGRNSSEGSPRASSLGAAGGIEEGAVSCPWVRLAAMVHGR